MCKKEQIRDVCLPFNTPNKGCGVSQNYWCENSMNESQAKAKSEGCLSRKFKLLFSGSQKERKPNQSIRNSSTEDVIEV
jgi:hypothetical protein